MLTWIRRPFFPLAFAEAFGKACALSMLVRTGATKQLECCYNCLWDAADDAATMSLLLSHSALPPLLVPVHHYHESSTSNDTDRSLALSLHQPLCLFGMLVD
jgi:hypothetical protein